MSKLDRDELLERTQGGLEVFQHYSHYLPDCRGSMQIGQHYTSPFGHEGRKSFDIYWHRDYHAVWYRDHAFALHGDCFDFVQRIEGVEFRSSMEIIARDVLGMSDEEMKGPARIYAKQHAKLVPLARITDVPQVELVPTIRAWNAMDEAFFARNLTSLATVEKYHGRAVQGYEINKADRKTYIREAPQDPIYGYNWPATGHWKLYRPKSARFKWISNTDARKDVFGFDLLPDSCPAIFVVAGNRDTMGLHELAGVPTIAVQSESVPLDPQIGMLLSLIADKVYSVMDPDDAGERATMKLYSEFGIRPATEGLRAFYRQGHDNDYSAIIERHRTDTAALAAVRTYFHQLANPG